jgi:hypothetical protein
MHDSGDPAMPIDGHLAAMAGHTFAGGWRGLTMLTIYASPPVTGPMADGPPRRSFCVDRLPTAVEALRMTTMVNLDGLLEPVLQNAPYLFFLTLGSMPVRCTGK